MESDNVVSAFEAKTHLSRLLRDTERGCSFIIRRRGKAVARLIPSSEEERPVDIRAVLADFRRIRARIPGRVSVRKLIDEGRRH